MWRINYKENKGKNRDNLCIINENREAWRSPVKNIWIMAKSIGFSSQDTCLYLNPTYNAF